MDASVFVNQHQPYRAPRQLSAAAAAAYAGGMEALLSHEAALQRNVTSRLTLFCTVSIMGCQMVMCRCLCGGAAPNSSHLVFALSPILAVLPFDSVQQCMTGGQHCRYMHLFSWRMTLL